MQGSPYGAPHVLHSFGAAVSLRRASCGGHGLPDMVEYSSRGGAEQAAQRTSIGAKSTTPSCRSGGRVISWHVATPLAFAR